MLKSHKIKIIPNATMRNQLEQLFNYRRNCWNQGLNIWNDMYESSLVMATKRIAPMSVKFVMNSFKTKQTGNIHSLLVSCKVRLKI